MTVTLSQKPERAPREAEVEIRAKELTLRHPKNRSGLPDVACSIVYVQEVSIPEDSDAPGMLADHFVANGNNRRRPARDGLL